MRILRATITHLDDVVRLFNSYRMFYKQSSDLPRCKKFIEQRLKNKDSVIFLAFTSNAEGEQARGFTQLYPTFTSVGTNKIFVLNDLYVDESERNKGVGKALLDMAKDFAIEQGASKLTLMTAKDNPAQKLYEHEGYKKDEMFMHYNLLLSTSQNSSSNFISKTAMLPQAKIINGENVHIDGIAKLFNEYRMFYKQDSDFDRAKKFIQERLLKKDSVIYVAVDPKTSLPIGFAQLYPSYTSVGTQRIYILNDLYVAPEIRGAGIGSLLMNKVKEYAIEQSAAKLTLMTAFDNKVGQKLYEREGYLVDDKFLHYNLILNPVNNLLEESRLKVEL
jgi:ribosomal protein S18 acetylase RimI-like enzyme